jgi:hypothetical protein
MRNFCVPTLLSKKTMHRQLERKWIERDVYRNFIWKRFYLFFIFVTYRDPPEKILLTEASPYNFYSLVHVISSWFTTFSIGECVEIKPYKKRLLFELIEKPYEYCDVIALLINITFILGGIP